ncbi:MAG: DUF3857 domain-containing protein [Bacteroidales bacterium]|nr:DUF3857 domain-containing protein [Bacteroidales bacterium]
MKRFCLPVILLLAVLPFSSVAGQDIKFNPKFEAVSEEEVKMTSYPRDTSAAAVIIYKELTRTVFVSPGFEFYLKNINRYRFKVLKESAKDIGDFEIIYRTDGEMSEKIHDIKVTTFNWENGKVVKTKMGKEFIFDQKYSDHAKRISFSAQNVKVGSVIEVTFERLNKHYWDIGDITFQGSIPVNCVEAKVRYPEWLVFNAMSRGLKLYSSNQSYETDRLTLGTGKYADYNSLQFNYRAVNLPALKAEDNVYCISQFYSAVSYELAALRLPGQVPKTVAYQWSDVDKRIMESDIFSELNSSCKFKDEVDPIKNSDKSFKEKVVAIRNLVAGKVKWNKTIRLVPKSASSVLKESSGSNADINALTGSALKYAGFTVTPVAVKLRTSGELQDFHISLDAFDTFVLKVASDKGEVLMLDAAFPTGYVNIFPYPYLVPKARQIVKDQSIRPWIDLTSLTKNQTSYNVHAKLDEDGLLSGTMKIEATGEESMYLKEFYNSYDEKEKFYAALEKNNSYTIVDLTVQNMDEYTPDCSMTVGIESQMQTTEDRIYLKPVIETLHSEGRFKSETRSVPVDFPYRETTVYNLVVEIPEGYEIEQMPSNSSAGSTKVDSKADIVYKKSEDGRKIEVSYIYVLNDMYADPRDYQDFRRYWMQLAKLENETIVLKKK